MPVIPSSPERDRLGVVPATGALDARAVDAEPVLPAVGPSSQLWMALVLGKGPAIQPSLGARSSGYSF